MRRSLRCRFVVAVVPVVLAAFWTGGAAAAPPQRTVTFEATSTFTSPFCGDALIAEHDVGRITYTEFFNPGGSSKAFMIHDTAVTQTLTNTETGATLTDFFSQLVDERFSIDPSTGDITITVSVDGLNFIIRGTNPPLVSAGRGVLTFLITFDAQGNPTVTQIGETATPNLVHLTQLLCA
jgi:hypothetical protein